MPPGARPRNLAPPRRDRATGRNGRPPPRAERGLMVYDINIIRINHILVCYCSRLYRFDFFPPRTREEPRAAAAARRVSGHNHINNNNNNNNNRNNTNTNSNSSNNIY